MKRAFAFAVLCLSLAACAVESGSEPEQAVDTEVSTLTEQSSESSDLAETGSSSVLACSSLWECEVCRNGTTRNVLYEVCDDGSQTLVLVGDCGRACF